MWQVLLSWLLSSHVSQEGPLEPTPKAPRRRRGRLSVSRNSQGSSAGVGSVSGQELAWRSQVTGHCGNKHRMRGLHLDAQVHVSSGATCPQGKRPAQLLCRGGLERGYGEVSWDLGVFRQVTEGTSTPGSMASQEGSSALFCALERSQVSHEGGLRTLTSCHMDTTCE